MTGHNPRSMRVTGGAGFIGANFVEHVLRTDPDVHVTTLDALTYAGSLDNLSTVIDDPRHDFVKGDITDRELLDELIRERPIDTVVHFAAESHVDRSISGPAAFIETNLVGTFMLLEVARDAWLSNGTANDVRFHHVSTDEVFGSLGEDDPPFNERTPYSPNSPYSASKAGSDHLVNAYHHTYGLPVKMTNCSNNYGPYQFPEKVIPLFVTNAIDDMSVPLYGDGLNVRDWLHVTDHCRALDLIIEKGTPGEVYNIGGGNEVANVDLTRAILELLGKPESLIARVPDRPGHDRRYSLDTTKLAGLGWQPRIDFRDGLRDTVAWYRANEWWWRPVKEQDPAFRAYYETQYGRRLS